MGNVARPTSTDPQPTEAHERVRDLAAGRRSRRSTEQSAAHPSTDQRRDVPVGSEAQTRDARERARPAPRTTRE